MTIIQKMSERAFSDNYLKNLMHKLENVYCNELCKGWYYVKKKYQLNRNFFYLTSTFEKC